jgi:hypothetical protein
MIAHNVQTSDMIANALVLVYFKTTPFYSLQKTFHCSIPYIYLIHTLSLQYICLSITCIIRCVKLVCRLHHYYLCHNAGLRHYRSLFNLVYKRVLYIKYTLECCYGKTKPNTHRLDLRAMCGCFGRFWTARGRKVGGGGNPPPRLVFLTLFLADVNPVKFLQMSHEMTFI